MIESLLSVDGCLLTFVNMLCQMAVVTGKPSDDAVKKAVEDLGFVFKGKK